METRIFSVEDGQLIFQALSELPFKYVYELIGKMNRVANETTPVIRNGSVCHAYALTPEETALIVRALGEMPYAKVFHVIRKMEVKTVHDAPSA